MEKIQKISFRRLWNGVISLVKSLEESILSVSDALFMAWMNFKLKNYKEILEIFLLLLFFYYFIIIFIILYYFIIFIIFYYFIIIFLLFHWRVINLFVK